MLHKYLFRKGDIPRLYDVTKIDNETYALTMSKIVFDSFAAKLPEEVLQSHFEIGRLLTKTEKDDKVVLTFNPAMGGQAISIALAHLFNWLNDCEFCALLPAEGPKQVCAFTFARTALAVSFAPWTHPYLQDLQISAEFFTYAEEEMKRYNMRCLRRNKPCTYIECIHHKEGIHFNLFGNGLWMAGTYKDEITTHNCDTTVDQMTFFVGIVAVSDALKRFVKEL